ncbi:MAG: Arm DNA-binding domain-containing protein [Steroidobacteraceae bacterium]
MAHLAKRFTDALVFSQIAPASEIHWDDELRRFAVRVYPNGAKSCVFGYRHQGRRRLLALGRVTELTLDQARDLPLSHKRGLRQEDADPLLQRERAPLGDTIAKLRTAYLERNGKARKGSWPLDALCAKAWLRRSSASDIV